MKESLFSEYVKGFMPKLQKFIELVNGKRGNLQTYLHKTMLRKEYSADQKWESASVNTQYVAADMVSMDSPLPAKARDSVARATGILPKIGMKKILRETQINATNIMKAQGATQTQIANRANGKPKVTIVAIQALLHQILRENLASFDDGSLCLRAEAGNSDRRKCVNATENERIVGGDDGVVDLVFGSELHDTVNVLRADVNAGRVSGDTAVSGQTPDGLNVRILLDRFDYGVFTAAAADDENIHRILFLLLNVVGEFNECKIQNAKCKIAG